MSKETCHSNEDFKLITYKRGKKFPKNKNLTKTDETGLPIYSQFNKEILLRRIQEAKLEISESDIFASVSASLREGLVTLENPTVQQIICFGLGKIDLYGVSIRVYDPVFTDIDYCILESFQCHVLKENFEGKYKVEDKSTTIFYMPHCPNQLTNNLLWANWGIHLNYCIIIANSFNSIMENTPKRILNKNAELIVNIFPYVLELAVINTFRFYEIFNDTAIHVFPWNKMRLLSDDFWSFCSEPNYLEDDIEFIRNKS